MEEPLSAGIWGSYGQVVQEWIALERKVGKLEEICLWELPMMRYVKNKILKALVFSNEK